MPALVLLDVGLPGEDGFARGALAAREERPGLHHHGDGGRRHGRPRGRAGDRRRRLHRQALRPARAAGPHQERAAPRQRRGGADRRARACAWAAACSTSRSACWSMADGSEETLSASEFDLLKVFAENPNRPLARDWLLETVGHREMEVFDRAIDLRITRHPAQDREGSGASRGDPHRARRRLHVRAAQGLRGDRGEHTAGGHGP